MTQRDEISTLTKRQTFHSSDDRGQLVCSVSLPSFEGHERINSFYCRIADACLDYCKGELLRRYESERGEGKPWEIRYKLSVSAQRIEDSAAVTLSVTLSDAFAHKTLAKHYETHLWSLEDDRMIPPQKSKKSNKDEQKT